MALSQERPWTEGIGPITTSPRSADHHKPYSQWRCSNILHDLTLPYHHHGLENVHSENKFCLENQMDGYLMFANPSEWWAFEGLLVLNTQ